MTLVVAAPAMARAPVCAVEDFTWLVPAGADNGPIAAFAVYDDGAGSDLYMGGGFLSAGGVPAAHIVRWDGDFWSALGTGVNDDVYDLAVFDDGQGPALHVSGRFDVAGGVGASGIAKWDGVNWKNLGDGITNGGSDPRVRAIAVFDDGLGGGPALYAAGTFTHAGDVAADGVARWDGHAWSAVGGGLAGSGGLAQDLAVYDDGSGPALYLSGSFDTVGGQSIDFIARWNGVTWSPVGAPLVGVGTPGVMCMTVYDDGRGDGPGLYVGGWFQTAGGLTVKSIARWDGQWSALGVGVEPINLGVRSLAAFDDQTGAGPALYVGGFITSAGGEPANHIARWDGEAWSTLAEGVGTANSHVDAIIGFNAGSCTGPSLFVGGAFFIAGTLPANHVARWACPTFFCQADVNGDDDVNEKDLAQLLNAWGACDRCIEDLDGDGSVAADDLANLLAAWGGY